LRAAVRLDRKVAFGLCGSRLFASVTGRPAALARAADG
jgi:hypothetical protein